MNELFFIRHGKAPNNILTAESVVGSNPGLSPEGKAQIRSTSLLVSRLAARGVIETIPSTIYSSTYKRARESARIIADRQGQRIVLDKRLIEIQKGDWHGRPVSEILEIENALTPEEKIYTRPPGGENYVDVAQRVGSFVNLLVSRQEHTSMIVSHDNPIQSAIGYLCEQDPAEWRNYSLDNGSLTRIFKETGKKTWRLDEDIHNLTPPQISQP
ncbi:MAG: fructose-2,6-bisphosphatase [Candidatus Saccharibacteria bacterium]|nr:fructose-2,6-bisphosphatase [Candidatus Saccharibacteria bacterium]